jgi:DNA repair protein RecN (Recombination protein N)
MLKHLTIQNYALIDQLNIDLSNGLTIITGETGAGKSILLGAVSLMLGQRADVQALQDKTKKCVVEGSFDIKDYQLKNFFDTNELDYETTTTIRREINPEGKSRAFVNDTPVNLSVLKDLVSKLIDVHSQHETLTLNNSDFQLSIVDAYAGNEKLLTGYKAKYKEYKSIQQKLSELTEQENQSKKDLDYFQFQYNELDSAKLGSISQEKMEQELETLNNAESIKQGLSKAYASLNEGEVNLLSSLNEVRKIISDMARFNDSIKALNERLNSSYIELKDIAGEIENCESIITHDPGRIEELTGSLDEVYRLQQKHQVKTVEELVRIKNELSAKLSAISSLEEQISKLEKDLGKIRKEILQAAKTLSVKREEVIPKIEKEIKKMLADLGMPNAQLKINNRKLNDDEVGSDGLDKINFLFSANKGGDLRELNKVASGGELSRLMLSLKSLIAQLTALPVIIFDEIDTGVSGDIADKMGIIMQKMAGSIQVITITHLPQIASKGKNHLFVHKEEETNKTYTRIRSLNKEERIQEIAKMLSKNNPTPAAIKNAKELLNA